MTECPKTQTPSTFYLGDDGTMDTVVYCSECGAESRYNYQSDCDEENLSDTSAYQEWLDYILEDAAIRHEED